MKIMDMIQLLNTGILIIGLPLILKAFLDIGRKLQLLEVLEREIRTEIKPMMVEMNKRISELEKRIAVLEEKVNIMWEWFSRNILLDVDTRRNLASSKSS